VSLERIILISTLKLLDSSLADTAAANLLFSANFCLVKHSVAEGRTDGHLSLFQADMWLLMTLLRFISTHHALALLKLLGRNRVIHAV